MLNTAPFNTTPFNASAQAETQTVDWSLKLTLQTQFAVEKGNHSGAITQMVLPKAAAARVGSRAIIPLATPNRASTQAAIRRAESRLVSALMPFSTATPLGGFAQVGLRRSELMEVMVGFDINVAERRAATVQLVLKAAASISNLTQLSLGKADKRQSQTRLYIVPAARLLRKQDLWFRVAHRPIWGKHPPPVPFPPPPPPQPKPAPKFLPQAEHYQVTNSASVIRLDDGSAIECKSLSISTDMQSWSRRFSGQVIYRDIDHIRTNDGPVDIQITANGVIFRAVITSFQDNRQFNSDTASFNAVSRCVSLAKPYALLRTQINEDDANAYQLALSLLEFTGWTLNWVPVDWLIPAGVFSLVNASPMDGIKQLANAVGAFILCDKRYQVLHVTPVNPVAPWALSSATPDITLPVDAATVVAGEWIENPRFNGVWVSGQNAGVCALVRRDGTAGDVLAGMVVDPLLTVDVANRARGIAVLAESGARQPVTLTLGIHPEIGVIEPGQIVHVEDVAYHWTGVCQSNSINISWQDDGLMVKQNPVILRWYG